MDTFQKVRERLQALGTKEMTLSDEEVARLDQEIDQLLVSIAEEPDAQAAEPKMMQLGEMTDVLAIICFGTKLPFTDKQRQLVRNYDRWFDAESRQRCFGWIKAGTFP
jgi:hypothetical protein